MGGRPAAQSHAILVLVLGLLVVGLVVIPLGRLAVVVAADAAAVAAAASRKVRRVMAMAAPPYT